MHDHAGFWRRNMNERDHLEDLGVDGKLMLKWILSRIAGRGLDSAGLTQGEVEGRCERGIETSGSTKCGEFLDWLKNCQLNKMDSAR